MALFGPRLDRPTALGDEGRPRATSLTVASLLVFVLLVVATTCPWTYSLSFGDGPIPSLVIPACAGLGRLTMAFGTVTGLLTAGLALLNRDRLTSLFVGQICFLPAGAALVAGLGALLASSPAYGLFFGGFALALVALGSTWTDTTSAESVRPALFQEGLTYLAMVGWAVVVALLVGAVLLVRTTVSGSGAGPTLSVLLFLVYVLVASVCFRLGLRWLPIRQLAPRGRLEWVERRLGQLRTANTILAAGSLVAVLCSLPIWYLGGFELLYAALPPLTRPVDTTANRLLAPVLSGLVLVIGFLPFGLSLVPVPGGVDPALLVLLLVAAPLGLYVAGWGLVLAQYLSLVPARAGGPALAATGMVVATVGSALVGLPTPVVLATAAVAMVVWDVSAFGLGVTAELGHLPETRRLELFHALVAVFVGAGAVLLLSLFDLLRVPVAGGATATVAAALAVFGVLLLLTPLRGYVAGEGGD